MKGIAYQDVREPGFIERLRGRFSEGFDKTNLLLIGTSVVVVYLVVMPVVMLIWTSLKTTPVGVSGPLSFENFVKAYSDPALLRLVSTSFLYAIGVCCVSLFFGFIMAWLVERTNTPGRNIAYALFYIQLFIPGMLTAIAYILLLSPRIGILNLALMRSLGLEQAPFNVYTLYVMVFAGGVVAADTMFLLLSATMRSMDPSLEEVASLSGSGTLRTMRSITFKLMIPAISAALIYNFIRAIESFEIPAVIGIPAGIMVFSSRIWMATSQNDYNLASALGVSMLIITVIGVLLYQRVTRRAERYVTVTGKGYRPRMINLGPWKWLGTAFLFVYLLFSVILPVLVLFWASLLPFYQVPSMEALNLVSLKSYQKAITYPSIQLATRNTLLLAVMGGVISMFLAAVISWIVVRSQIWGRRVLDILATTPLALPGIVMGLAVMFFYLVVPIPIYGTIWILLVVFVTKSMPWATRNINAAFLQVHRELEEASKNSGASWWMTFSRILVPLTLPAFISGFLWVFVHVVRELSAAVLLYSANSQTLSVIIWEMWNAGTISDVASLSIMMLILIGVVVYLGRWWMERVSKDRTFEERGEKDGQIARLA